MRDKNPKILAVGAVLSALMLIILASAHSQGVTFLALESRWLAVAGVPLLVALFVGGYITRFKGLGIELEGALQQKVEEGDFPDAAVLSLRASEVAMEAEDIAKGSLEQLNSLGEEEKSRVRRLRFVMQHHYFPNVIRDYMDALPELRFLEVRDGAGTLSCILSRESITDAILPAFVESLRNGTVKEDFGPMSIKPVIRSQDSFLVAIQKLRNSNLNTLPVVEGSEIIGILDRSSAFERLADALIRARLRT